MKTIGLIISSALAIALAGFCVAEHVQVTSLNQRMVSMRNLIESAKHGAETKDQTIQMLQSNVEQLTAALTNSTAQLTSANEQLRGYQGKEDEARAWADYRNKHRNDFPAPTVTTTKDEWGRQSKIITFPKVLAANGDTLAENAMFVNIYGRKLTFRPAEGMSIAVDVNRVNPGILEYLGINAQAANDNQARIDAAWKSSDAQRVALANQIAKERAVQEIRDAQIAMEKSKNDAEIAKLNAEEESKRQTMNNQTTEAQAAMLQAQAAMVQAQQGPNVIYNVQQQQQQQQQNRNSGIIWH